MATTGLQVGGLVVLMRVGLFWAALWLYSGHADWRQVVGYAVLILDSVLELTIAASLSGSRPAPPLFTTALIVLTSLALGFAWAWLRARPTSKRPSNSA